MYQSKRVESSQLMNPNHASELKALLMPESKTISILLTVYASPDLGFAYHKGTEGPHPDNGGDPKGTVQFLATYRGPFPKNIEALIQSLRGKSKEQKDEILASQDILYGYYPYLNGGKGDILPILKDSTISCFCSWEQHQHITNTMKELRVNSLVFAVEVPQVCQIFEGTARDSSQRPLFAGTIFGIDFCSAPVAEWRAAHTVTLPVIISEEYLGTPQLQFQQAAIEAQAKAGAEAGYRNKVMTGKSLLPLYMQENKPTIPTVGEASMHINTSQVLLEPNNPSTSNTSSGGGEVDPVKSEGTRLI